jgi:hypothetical protein
LRLATRRVPLMTAMMKRTRLLIWSSWNSAACVRSGQAHKQHEGAQCCALQQCLCHG